MRTSLHDAFEGLQIHLHLPDLWQQDAIRALGAGRDVIVAAPTGAGKTFIFENFVESGKFRQSRRQAVFTVPTRALANDKWREWKARGWNVGIATGDISENVDAPVLVATLETQREKLIQGRGPGILVIDEYQMIGDRQRGLHYELAIALAPPDTQLLLLSGSVGNPLKVAEWLRRIGRDPEVVQTRERPVPLDEMPWEGLPRQAPGKIKQFWAQLAVSTLLSDFGPLLIFAPHRKSAEKIARVVAEALPEDQPIEFQDQALRQACGKETAKLLKKRVAVHHSGISFAERAAIIEPLAKAGQLRVIVATMGLAAGINFSVRSVFVSQRSYQDGPFEREVTPAELLQMFGRAGRRGLDEIGYVIFGNKSPRLGDAHAMDLRRANEIDWPTLLRKMDLAAQLGHDPTEAARDLCRRLYSEQRISLGFTRQASGPQTRDSKFEIRNSQPGFFGLKAMRKEVLNASGQWEVLQSNREGMTPLGGSLAFVRGRYHPAEASSALVASLVKGHSCRLTRLDTVRGESRRYGVELMVGQRVPGTDFYQLTKSIRKWIRMEVESARMTVQEAASLLPEELKRSLRPARFLRVVERGDSLYLTGHFGEVSIKTYRDNSGACLYNPQTRISEIESETHYVDAATGESFTPGTGTPAYAWRKLGLIDDHGRPTRRGVICGFFQHGEGLAVAAALEDSFYPVEEMIYHFANLRAGYRFELNESIGDGESERLAVSCRQAYGPVDYEGYLRLGLPAAYGEGAAEVVRLWIQGKSHALFERGLDFGPGDVERAFVEWLSFLRHVRGAPKADIPRWAELQQRAEELLAKHDRTSPLQNLPSLPASLLQKPVQSRVSFSKL